jgi:hypothetical protein
MQDRPNAGELLAAIREFLASDVMAATQGRTAFLVRVCVNSLEILERELELGPAADAAERAGLVALLGHEGSSLRELEAELARRIRDGSLDDRLAEVLAHVRRTVRNKLAIANPKHLDASLAAAPRS